MGSKRLSVLFPYPNEQLSSDAPGVANTTSSDAFAVNSLKPVDRPWQEIAIGNEKPRTTQRACLGTTLWAGAIDAALVISQLDLGWHLRIRMAEEGTTC
ncbi:hypothetical protein AVEN_201498-1 [Araneus ventricosus]|uniref:Uncharacterized protein n=1 Tax=Araneus ventricosus TaxID=182803 RepID=A0A4Y2U970_ARAVE|nr:hypothetical protein AVEN_201498-1 [Araneus ventricosus]